MPKEDPFVNRAQLLKAIKKYPEIWDSNNKLHMCRSVTAPMWNEIAELFGNHVPTVKLQSIWSQMKYHYHNLVHRQILHKERFTTKWEHFEPMSFMYNITVAKIIGSNNSDGTNDTSESLQSPNMGYDSINPQMQNGKNKSPNKSAVPSQGRGRPSGSFSWMAAVNNSINKKSDGTPNLSHVTSLHQNEFTFNGFTGLVPPAIVTVETSTTPLRKPGRPGSTNNISMRARIIDVIKANPILWSGRPKDHRNGQCRTSTVWKEVATQLGLTPSLVQTRWSIIKQRYVDELQKERRSQYTGQFFESSWEHFQRMSFMREILIKKVDEREHTREQIQEIVSEHHNLQNQTQNSHSTSFHHHNLRYMRSPTMTMASGVPLDIPSTQLNVCDDSDLSGHPSMKRRVKTEADLEWDPFEMILQVHGNETQEN